MKEEEIRPKELLQKYMELSSVDATGFLNNDLIEINCPGCGKNKSTPHLKKNGFQYVLCQACGSLYCTPRPTQNRLTAFYKNSLSAEYWSKVFFPAVAEIRRKKLFQRKANQIQKILEEKQFTPASICDVGAGYGIFLEELNSYFPKATLSAIEPEASSAEKCREKKFDTLQAVAENSNVWAERFDLVISSEVIEHVFSTKKFIESLARLTVVGGYCLVTGLGYEGFDILSLQDRSNSIFPPHHLNFLSIKGFEELFHRIGFKEVEVTTPGELDLDITKNSDPSNEFLRVLFSRGEDAIQDFQVLLQKHKLSSHVWVWARK